MSIGTLVTRGYGSFGSIGKVVTAGYSQSNTISITDADANKIAQFVWERILENGYQAQEMMRLFASGVGGLVSGMEANNPVFKGLDTSKNRITAETDKTGNRITITYDLS
jgi:hypothetical protein